MVFEKTNNNKILKTLDSLHSVFASHVGANKNSMKTFQIEMCPKIRLHTAKIGGDSKRATGVKSRYKLRLAFCKI